MFKYILLIVFWIFFQALQLFGQCPDRVTLTRELQHYESDYISVPSIQQLNKLRQYERLLKNCSYQTDSIYAHLLQRIGIVYYKQHQYLDAVYYINRSNDYIKTRINEHTVDPTFQIKNYFVLSMCYDSLHMPTRIIAAVDSCIFTFSRLQNDKNTNVSLQFIIYRLDRRAQSLYDMGEYKRATDFAGLGERIIYKSNGYKDSMEMLINFSTIKVNALLADQKYFQAEGLLVKMVQDCIANRSFNMLGTSYDLLGQVQISKDKPLAAKLYFEKSLNYELMCKDTAGCMLTYTNLGYYLADKYYHNSHMALDYYKKALASFNSSYSIQKANRMQALNLLDNFGNIYAQQKKYDSAFRYYQLAFSQIKTGLHESDLLDMPVNKITNIEYVTNLLLDEADAYYSKYKDRKDPACFYKAISIYKITDKLLDKIRYEQSDIQSKLFWRRDNHRLYEHAIEACFNFGNKTEEAFYFFEKSRAILLNDQMTEQLFLGNKDILKQAKLKRQAFELQTMLDAADTRWASYDEVQNRLLQYNEELDRLLQNSRSKNGHAYQKFSDSSSISTTRVQKYLLKDHEALVELFEGDSALYVITITAGNTGFTRINKADYDNTLRSYLTYISSSSLLNTEVEKYYTTARHLYRLLFPGKPLPSGRIIISPDGRYFPFETLLTSNDKKPAYFLYKYAVSYTYSARYLLMVNNYNYKAGADTKMLLGIAPVSYKYDETLPDLLESDASVKRVQSYFSKADVMMHEEASKKNFLDNFYHYKIIYLSTHASDSGKTGEPVISFADKPMTLSELVAETRPETELIIASACKTALGVVYRGEGVYNFSRGFAAVGIPACVSNLWSVQSSSANQLTEIFCKYVSEGLPTDVALQKAKMDFIGSQKGNQQLPFFWAASILSGKTGVIGAKQPLPRTTILLLSLIAVITAAGCWVYLSKSNRS